jgi:predicted  nucleic acid-binding Zn-ribbon protein
MEEQARIQSDIRDAERRQRKLRQEIFEVEDQILAKRDELVESVRGMLKQSVSTSPLFTIRWTLTGAQKQSEERLG